MKSPTILPKITEKLFQKNILSHINLRCTSASALKIGSFVLKLDLSMDKELRKNNHYEKDRTRLLKKATDVI